MSEIKSISINKLLLDLENPRFPDEVDNQRDAINKMLEIQEEKIVRLAKDIAHNGLDPSENLIVIESSEEPGFFIVAEGNRRTTALKLLNQPNLANSDRIKNNFAKIKATASKVLSKASCVIFDDESYDHWVDIKHTGDNKGVGRERWTTPEADRYRARHGKSSFQVQLYDFMQNQEVHYAEILKNKKYVYITNLGRLFGDKEVRGRFGLDVMDGKLYCSSSFSSFLEKYKKVLEVMTTLDDTKGRPEFNVNRIRYASDRIDFLDELEIFPDDASSSTSWQIAEPSTWPNDNKDGLDSSKLNLEEDEDEEIPDLEDKETESDVAPELNDANGRTTEAGDESDESEATEVTQKDKSELKRISIPKPDRNVIVPSNLRLNFGANIKCARIFSELKTKLTHKETAFSIAVMLRVFIDLSVTTFIEKKQLKFKDPSRTPGLHDKVIMCCDHLRENNLLTQSQCSSIGAFSKNSLNASGTIQQYVHNQHSIPSKAIVNTEWDNFQPLFEAIWSNQMQS